MRTDSDSALKKFDSLDASMKRILAKKTFDGVNKNTHEVLVVLRFDLIFENILQTWVEIQSGGYEIFKDLEKSGFHNKAYMAKNLKFDKGIFQALLLVNEYRNKFAHRIESQELTEKEIIKLKEKIESINYGKSDGLSDILSKAENNRQRVYFLMVSLLSKIQAYIYNLDHYQ
jgi:hypothetical protein